ncbi:PE-PGRS family protein [Mycobacterium sp. 155]|uniref:PE-PGRS family protein n=1 Tax=Mycobacterium sp. 155 TaxID=1157943 RepID=UPI0003A44E8A|nr:PE-PGRS family protein [Mycobacterium sp. 155]
MMKLNLGTRIKRDVAPLVFAGAVASAIAAAPFATAQVPGQVASVQPGTIATVPLDPGGGGCINGQCGSGGTDNGPGGGPGGSGCVPGPNGPICGSGGVNGGPGGVPGGGGCVPGMGCGSGHG